MNGTRLTFMRKGYWLTALATAVLLAASPGTAQAQTGLAGTIITLEAPSKVTEGGDIIITVKGKTTITAATAKQDVTVVIDFAVSDDVPEQTAEIDEAGNTQVDDATIVSNPSATLTFAANSSASESRERTASATVTVRTNHDADAEDEVVVVTGTTTADSVADGSIATKSFTITDDETQTYVLTLDRSHTSTMPPKEGLPVMASLAAKPAHYDDGVTLTLNVTKDGKRASNYSATGPANGLWVVKVGTEAVADRTAGVAENTRLITIGTPSSDGNRVTDTVTLEVHSGPAGSDKQEASLDIDVLDIHTCCRPRAPSRRWRRTRTATRSRRSWKAATRSS